MTNLQPDASPVTIPLTETNHQTAQRFYAHHADPGRAKQVYLNTLCVQAVHFYMICLGFDPDLQEGMSWNPALQVLTNTADLWVSPLGRLECCPVLPGMDGVPIFPQTVTDRIGYIAVRLNSELTEAELLGFVPTLKPEWVEAKRVPFIALQSLNDLPDYFASLAPGEGLATTPEAAILQEAGRSPIPRSQLSQWLTDQFTEEWFSLESIIDQLLQQPDLSSLAYGFRQPLPGFRGGHLTSDGTKRGKFLTLGKQADEKLLLIVGVTPIPAQPDLNITVEIYPLEFQSYLPKAIQLAVLDEQGKAVLQAEGGNSEGLEFQFSGEPGERFSVRISVNGDRITEDFQI
ncbi:MAG: DUF1822 family protein [Synechococcales bacterium]|nr:DUF1822 family protein [Synechococcales bacterium]